jgi:uncharacterized cupredoxin-like copper-binding protein
MNRLRVGGVAVAALALFAVPACSKASAAAPLHVSVKEFRLVPTETSVKAGKVKLTVANNGKVEHEVVAFKSDLPDGGFPMTADKTRVNEDGAGITHIDPEAEEVKPGKTKTVTLDLKPGRYVFVCNISGHYTQGMHAVVNVTA